MLWNPKLLLLISLALLQSLTFCQGQERVVLTDQDAGKAFRVHVQSTLVVRLAVTPAIGEVWHIASSEGLQATEESRFELLEDPKPGARAQQVFKFVVQKTGMHDLSFTLDRGRERKKAYTFKLDARD